MVLYAHGSGRFILWNAREQLAQDQIQCNSSATVQAIGVGMHIYSPIVL